MIDITAFRTGIDEKLQDEQLRNSSPLSLPIELMTLLQSSKTERKWDKCGNRGTERLIWLNINDVTPSLEPLRTPTVLVLQESEISSLAVGTIRRILEIWLVLDVFRGIEQSNERRKSSTPRSGFFAGT